VYAQVPLHHHPLVSPRGYSQSVHQQLFSPTPAEVHMKLSLFQQVIHGFSVLMLLEVTEVSMSFGVLLSSSVFIHHLSLFDIS